ncbi:bifunctional solanapyrone synthase [Podospora fimiseda]|uniref:Bifunctional solanapyrone synthase n=1 Tax=Podospora fimiseda TaxID=252190 RepID=A0AAN7GUC9_9PEZI|nr:bifunctional solanapyrone synthase [Podospora fimiseda]
MAPSLRSIGITAFLAVEQTLATSSCTSSKFTWESTSNQLTPSSLSEITTADTSFLNFDSETPSQPSSRFLPLPKCKLLPGDPLWPSSTIWSLFNLTLSGALIKTIPLAAPCYNNTGLYSSSACQQIRERWSDPHLHVDDPSSTMWPLYQGRTCLPTEDPTSSNCTLGGYASYSVAVTKVKQIQLAINFARNLNLRLVVKNTGHDFADKSIGAGALSIWTHKLKDIRFIPNYNCGSRYSGPAFRLGAGIETEEVYQAAEANNVTVVGGECRTVGMAGGYIAGGGHSPVSALAGMGADQVLEMEVVLPSGKFVTVNEGSYPDLFWALRGGGGSTYGVVTSVVVRAYPQIPITTLSFVFATGPNVTVDTFFAGVKAYMSYFDTITSAGAYGYFLVVSFAPGEYFFSMMPLWGNNMTQPQFETLLNPFLTDLTNLGIPFEPVWKEYDSFYKTFTGTWGPEVVGAHDSHAASRLFPKENFEPAKINQTLAAVRHAIEGGAILIGHNIRAAPNPTVNQDNAVHPAWRKTTGFFILAASWPATASDSVIQERSETLTNDWMAQWRAISPSAGSYLSEGDINEPNMQDAFYGIHYPRLLALKKKYDPTGLFYAPTAVGSEDWYITGQVPWIPTQNGRLCRRT